MAGGLFNVKLGCRFILAVFGLRPVIKLILRYCLSTLLTADRLAQLVEHRTAVREVAGSNLDRTNTQGLKITEEKVLPL